MKYRSKPVEIEAMVWDGTDHGAMNVIEWINRIKPNTATYRTDRKALLSAGRGITFISDRIEIKCGDNVLYLMPEDAVIYNEELDNEFYPRGIKGFNRMFEPEPTADEVAHD